jgi:hypothetical protein
MVGLLTGDDRKENLMKTKLYVLFFVAAILLLNSNANAASKDINPGTYENWGRMINKLEIIKSFKITDYSQMVLKDIDISNIQYQLLNFPEDKKISLINEGSRLLIDKIKNNPGKMEVVEDNSPKSDKSIILNISIRSVGVEQKTIWWHPLAWAEIQGELIDAQNNEVFLRFETRRTTSARGVNGGILPETLDDNAMNKIMKAINNDFKEIGDDLNVLIFSFN